MRKCLIFLVGLYLGAPLCAEQNWQPTLEPRGITNGYRQGIGGELVLPISQSRCSLLFGQVLGGRFQDEWVGSFGAGYRRLAPSSCWAWGVNGFVDGALADRTTYFQGGVGVELFGPWWEARANGYLPCQRVRNIGTYSTSSLELQGRSLLYHSAGHCVRERTYAGFDAEVGAGFNICRGSLWGYGGYYRFTANHLETIEGPRVRVVYSYDGFLNLFATQLTLGALYERDRVHGNRVGAEIGIRIPIGPLAKSSWCRPSSLLRRMGERVVRQEGILKGCERFALPNQQGLVSRPDGTPREILFVHAGDPGEGTQEDPTTFEDALAWAQPGDTLVLSRKRGDIWVNPTLLPPQVDIIGFGEKGEAVLYAQGASYRLTDPAGRAALVGNGKGTILQLNSGSSISGIGIEHSSIGIEGREVENVRLTDVRICRCRNDAIRLQDATNVTCNSLTMSDIGGWLVSGERTANLKVANVVTTDLDEAVNKVTFGGKSQQGISLVDSVAPVLENLDLTLYGDHGIRLHRCQDAVIKNAIVDGSNTSYSLRCGINLHETDDVSIKDVMIRGVYKNALKTYWANSTYVSGLDAQTDIPDALYIEGGRDFALCHSTLSGADEKLVNLDRVTGSIVISDNLFEGTTHSKHSAVNLEVSKSDPVSLQFCRNEIRNCKGGGLSIGANSNAPVEVLFAQNVLTNLGGDGLYCLQNAKGGHVNVQAVDNNLTNTGGGIFLATEWWAGDGIFEYLVDGNMFTNISGKGVTISHDAYQKKPLHLIGTVSNNRFIDGGGPNIYYHMHAWVEPKHTLYGVISGNTSQGGLKGLFLADIHRYSGGDVTFEVADNHDFGSGSVPPYAVNVGMLHKGKIQVEMDGNTSSRDNAKILFSDWSGNLRVTDQESLSERNGDMGLKLDIIP